MPRRRFACCLAVFFAFATLFSARASDSFPFGDELVLDAAPMHGSKRVPMIEIEADGKTSIDLWCASLRGQSSVGDGSIAIVPEVTPQAPCDADREARDIDLLTALSQVTGWRKDGDAIELTGPKPLRFHLMTN